MIWATATRADAPVAGAADLSKPWVSLYEIKYHRQVGGSCTQGWLQDYHVACESFVNPANYSLSRDRVTGDIRLAFDVPCGGRTYSVTWSATELEYLPKTDQCALAAKPPLDSILPACRLAEPVLDTTASAENAAVYEGWEANYAGFDLVGRWGAPSSYGGSTGGQLSELHSHPPVNASRPVQMCGTPDGCIHGAWGREGFFADHLLQLDSTLD